VEEREPNKFHFQKVDDLTQVGMSSERLSQTKDWIEQKAGKTPYGCLILRNGKVAAEWYGGGFSAESLFEIGSIRKSFNSALIGIGLEEEKIDLIDLNVRAVDVWSDITKISGDPADETITLHQLVSGTSGWLTPDPPGKTFVYNNAAFTAAERVVAAIYGLAGDQIAPQVVRKFKIPLEAESWKVYHFERKFTPQDIENPGPKLAIDSNLRDLIKWGYLWLEKGIWDGKELIPREYVSVATNLVNPQITNACYGYNWFINSENALWPDAPEDSYGHAGFGTFKPSEKESRAYLWICPSLNIVAAIVADVSVGFANDFLDVPLGITAEWIGRIVYATN
jgi:CubicO group peptidase (beta-lactamase class C family)